MAKTKDIFLNIAANPDFTLEDLVSVGLTSENTVLLDRAQYASNERVQDMFRDSEGNFDERKFNTFYDLAEQSYNIIAQDEANISLLDVTAYDADNIFVDPSKRKRVDKPYAVKLPNPDRLNVGITRVGKIGPRTLSQDEIAQTQEVLLNPTGVANGEKPIYGKAPNESWFEDFWDPKVLAAWDEDGTHIDPVPGREVQHKKGDLKLNDNGTYYYESLDGRSVYGKRILNKFNTLTTDGSSWNKYDFFDSDDIEQKSIGGSIAKNLALVGSMFIPYVGWGVAAASVAHQSAGLFATLGKMLAGSDNETLNAVEGWVKSTDRRNLKTEYAQQHTWCWENFIDLIGDTTAQLREQRAIFKFAPGIIKGDFKPLSEKAMKEVKEKIVKESMENVTSKSFNDIARIAAKQNPKDWKKQIPLLMGETRGVFSAKADKIVRDYLNSYYKLGEPIAKAYMTAITVQDTFGEAIQAGATDTEATLLTLGYAAAEAALLSTDLGKWIMPELRTEKLRMKMIANKLLELPQETREMSRQLSRLAGESKKEWAKCLFNVGKDIATAEYSMLPKTLGTIAAQGLGEGIEEVSEEALADFSKSCFNLVQQLQGDETRMHAWNHGWNWAEARDRYGMSFFGGILGGGINAAASDYKANREILNMDSQQAMQQLVYMSRNNELEDFWKVVNKTTLASKELSTQLNEDGSGYKPGTKEDNQDLAAKRALRKQIDLIESIINAENAKLDDQGLLSALIKADPALKDLDPVKEYRMRALSNSATAGRFLNEWNTITSDIIKNRMEQKKITDKYGDKSSEKMSDEDEQALKAKQKELKELQKRKDEMLEGGRTREYVRDAVFEMTHGVNEVFNDLVTEVRYAEAKTGKKYSDISDDEKQELKAKYDAIKNSNQYAEVIHELADVYETLAITASNGIQQSSDFYEQIKNKNYQNIKQLDNIVSQRLKEIQTILSDKDNGIATLQDYLYTYNNRALESLQEDAIHSAIAPIHNDAKSRIDAILNGREESQVTDSEKNAINAVRNQFRHDYMKIVLTSLYDDVTKLHSDFHKVGFIHPEVKEALKNMTSTLSDFSSKLQQYYDPEDPSASDDANWDDSDYYAEFWPKLDQLNADLDKLANTPIIENLRQFQLSTVVDKTVLDLLDFLQKEESANITDISSLEFDRDTLQLFKDARDLLTMYRSAIVGARFDHVDLDNIVGFNTTLNEISGKNETPKLAEIDAQTADLILEDINKLLARINYSEEIHKLNTGNKYHVQDKTALNKQYIMFNKIRSFVSILEKDEDWKNANGLSELKELLIAGSKTLNANSGFGGKYTDRVFSLSVDQKNEIEKESILIQQKLHDFFQSNLDLSSAITREASIDKLAKLFTYGNFKGLIRENNDSLSQTSEDIDDSAFIWWLCASAALSSDQFYNNYRHILGTEKEGEKLIAPIPTQELGVFALTAAIVDGDMFKVFGEALRKSLNNFWENTSETDRNTIQKESGMGLFISDKYKQYFKNGDFLPNFDNILFVEGIAGSGKTVGVLKTLSRLLAKTNPEFISQKVLFAHTNKIKAENLGNSTEFKNFEAHDHNSLLSYMSADYTPMAADNGAYKYKLDKDIFLSDGIFRANWEVREYNVDEVPKLIIIDEWSHYNQVEQDLIQRFASKYGVTVLTMGDYDQITPESEIELPDGSTLSLNPHRNTTPRSAKLGISMRTDNNLKNENMSRMRAWVKAPTKTPINLSYFEDETGIYGDKLYLTDGTYGNLLQSIQNDVKRMIATLKGSETEPGKIGYIYHDTNSELYKWLTTTDGIKEHIVPLSEKDAHGEEAQYYIVENDRKADQNALTYFKSVYTGITRSEQGSILIAGNDYVHRNVDDKYNTAGVKFNSTKASEVSPDTYQEAGTKNFTNKRKATLDYVFQNKEVSAFDIKPRTRKEIPLNINTTRKPAPSNPPTSPTTSTPSSTPTQPTQPTPTNPTTNPPAPTPTPTNTPSGTTSNTTNTTTTGSTTGTNPSTSNEPDPNELPPIPENAPQEWFDQMNANLQDVPVARTEEEVQDEKRNNEQWEGPYQKGQIVYDLECNPFEIIDEDLTSNPPTYKARKISTDQIQEFEKDYFHERTIPKLPTEVKLLNVGDKVIWDNELFTIKNVYPELKEGTNEPQWIYVFENDDNEGYCEHDFLKQAMEQGHIRLYSEESEVLEARPSDYEVGSRADFEQAINEEFGNSMPIAVTQTPGSQDINFDLFGFTFQTQYFADEFDDQGKLIPTKDARIDNGYGLYKINQNAFDTKDKIKKAIGSIRKHLQFKSNADIVQHITSLTGKTNLTIRWGFISKTEADNQGRYSRFNAPKANIEYTQATDNQAHAKSLSAVIFDDLGNAILEIPIVMLQSPHSIFKQMKDAKIGQDITRIWDTKSKKEETYDKLKEILNYIKQNKRGLPGYEALYDLITLWQFTSNGIKFLPKDWNLHSNSVNLGNLFIDERLTEDIPEYDYSEEWEEVHKLVRDDRFVSSIFMNNTDEYETASGKLVPTYKAYNPYILISDSPDITNDVQAVDQYLYQISNPGSEEIVTLVPLSGPEVSVSEYITQMHKLITRDASDKTVIPFGNAYTPYRIWSEILKAPDHIKNFIMEKLPQEQRQEVINIVNQLQAVEASINPNAFSRTLDYQKACARKINEINARQQVFPKLRRYLVKTCFYNTFGYDQYKDEDRLNAIQQVCDSDSSKITGVVCKAQFAGLKTEAISKFAHKVKVDSTDRFKFPGYGYFRSYGKVDTPTYKLNNIKQYIKQWVNDSQEGIVITYDDGTEVEYPNVWKFKNKKDEELYLAKPRQSRINLEPTLAFCKELLGNLGLSEYSIDTSKLYDAQTDAIAKWRALQQIHEEFKKIPGSFIIKVNGVYKYGNIDKHQTSEYAGYTFKQVLMDKGKYFLEFENNDGNKLVEMQLDMDGKHFYIPSLAQTQTNSSENLLRKIEEVKNLDFLQESREKQLVVDTVNKIKNIIESGQPINQEVIDAIIDSSNAEYMTKIMIKAALQIDENQNIDCVIPTKISFLA